MEFPDVYKVRRSLWQVAGRWRELESLTHTELLYFLSVDKGQRVKPRRRSGCEYPLVHLLVPESQQQKAHGQKTSRKTVNYSRDFVGAQQQDHLGFAVRGL